MATIGAISVDVFRGMPPLGGLAVETMARRGRDYERFREIGMRSHPGEITSTTFYSTLNAATAHETACLALKATAVTIVDAIGISTANCMVLDVQVIGIRRCYMNGSTAYRVDVAWSVQAGAQ